MAQLMIYYAKWVLAIKYGLSFYRDKGDNKLTFKRRLGIHMQHKGWDRLVLNFLCRLIFFIKLLMNLNPICISE